MPTRWRPLLRLRWIIVILLVLLGLQSCSSSVGWESDRTQRIGRTILSDGLFIESGGGVFAVRYFYSDDDIADFRTRPPPAADRSTFYLKGPGDPLTYGDNDFYPERFLGLNYCTIPESQSLMGVRLFWISYWHLAAFFCIVPLYRVLRSRIQFPEPYPWQFPKRRQWLSQKLGLCPACGYDLRATPDRCPECGIPT
jgi:hypothetical protein